ncbi:MAG: hypothetical protein ACI857_001338 [Arenicella sp.]
MKHLLYSSITLILFACSYSHNQEVKIQNNSSFIFQIWSPDTTNTMVLTEEIQPGDFIMEDISAKGKAKSYLGQAPASLPFQPYNDSLSFEGKTLIKDLYVGGNWTSFLTGPNSKSIYMQFDIFDTDLQ